MTQRRICTRILGDMETTNMKPNALVLAVALALASVATGCATLQEGAAPGGGGGGGIVAGGADATSDRGATTRSDRWAGLPIGLSPRDEVRSTEPRPVPLHEAMTCSRCR